jgi:hypothetical protein
VSYRTRALGAADHDLEAWQRAVDLAAQAGIPVLVWQALRAVESGGRADAIRFEPHLFWRTRKGLGSGATGPTIKAAMTSVDHAAVPYTPGNRDWREAAGLPPCRISRAASCTGSETNRAAFERAFAVDPAVAVRSTSWGSGQVLGGHLLAISGNDPRRAVQDFFRDPVEVGDRLMVRWWTAARQSVRDAAHRFDWDRVASAYNGCTDCAQYVAKLTAAYRRVLPEWERVRGSIRHGQLVGGIASPSPAPIALAAVGGALAAGFAGWAIWRYTRPRR